MLTPMRILRAGALILVLGLGLAGCSGDYARLTPEADVPQLAALHRQTAEAGNHTALVETRGGSGLPLRVAVHETMGEHERVVVMLHGIMADHRTWRFLAGQLAPSCDLMLVDLPGAGDSDLATARTPESEFAPGALGDRVLEAVEARLRERGGPPPRVTIVAHSLAGAMTLRMFCDPAVSQRHHDLLARVDRLVLISPLDVAIGKQDPVFKKIAEVSGLEVSLGLATGVLRQKVAEATLGSVCDPTRALREEADTRIEYLSDPGRRRAVQAMLRQAVPWKDGRPDWSSIESLTGGYCTIDIPALIIWGRRDESLPIAMGYKLADELPRAELEAIPNVMHSPHIEAPEQTALLIREFNERRFPDGPAAP
jgi:pimeloyl-ACP methyl ester carboxylesterase